MYEFVDMFSDNFRFGENKIKRFGSYKRWTSHTCSARIFWGLENYKLIKYQLFFNCDSCFVAFKTFVIRKYSLKTSSKIITNHSYILQPRAVQQVRQVFSACEIVGKEKDSAAGLFT